MAGRLSLAEAETSRGILDRSIAEADRSGGTTDRSFAEKNAASRRRLASVVERLRESDMTLPTEEGGWTIAQVLGHLAFWDRSMETRWRLAREAAAEGAGLDPAVIPGELTDAINLPLAELLDAWAGRLGMDIGAQALAAAESLDALLIELAGRLPAAVAADRPNLLNRSTHRDAHVQQIERALAAGRPDATPVDRSYVARNAASLARLRDVLGGLSAADLARSTGDGEWTIGQIIGHFLGLREIDRGEASVTVVDKTGAHVYQPGFMYIAMTTGR